jgi:hypothetical protein
MQFINSRPDVVRSINQRWLLAHWNALRASSRLPAWRDLETSELAAMSANLSFFDVIESGGEARFLSRYRGARIAEAFGDIGTARYLDEILAPAYREAALTTYRQVLVTQLPVYTISDTRDRDGRIVHFERLLLPFSRDGVEIDRILASLETVSPEGAFENRGIMTATPKPPSFALCATIQHQSNGAP